MMYKGFWFQQKCTAAASRVDCYSDTARKRLVQVIFPLEWQICVKVMMSKTGKEREGVCLYLCYRHIPGFLGGKPACRPTGGAPQKIKLRQEARWKLTCWQPGLSCYQDNRLLFCLCRLIILEHCAENKPVCCTGTASWITHFYTC